MPATVSTALAFRSTLPHGERQEAAIRRAARA